jgi:hypothetical protein
MIKKLNFICGSFVFALLSASVNSVLAHDAGGPIDAGGNNANATDYGYVSCFDDGNGPADHLSVQIDDDSPAVAGLLVSLQVSKDRKMINVTDPISGDDQPSQVVSLKGGNGIYDISVNKTAAGVRNFGITYHCQTASGVHTGTDIGVYQLQ